MNNPQKVLALISWAESNISMFPISFKLSQGVTVLNSKLCIETAVSTLRHYVELNNYSGTCRTAYHRLEKLKTWLLDYQNAATLK